MLSAITAQYYTRPMMDANDGGWGVGMMFFSLVLVGLLVAGAIYFAKKHGNQTVQDVTPLDIAKARYARGDITKAEFDQLKKDLA